MKNFLALCVIVIVVGIIVLVGGCSMLRYGGGQQTINPIQYGINDAATGEERYYVLLRTHKEAQRLGVGVSYEGIKKIDLKIPVNATSIPLTHYTDFAGVTIQVENQKKDKFLFYLTSELAPVRVDAKEIDNQDFSKNQIIGSGEKLLIIYDKTLWVKNRIGYDKGTERKDIMLVCNGKGSNGPVQSYCTSASKHDCFYCDVEGLKKKIIKNVSFNRSNTSTKKTYFVKVENQYDVEISDITINTPDETGLVGDKAIYIVNCAKVVIKDVAINGTYSLPCQAGYGVSIHNIYDLYVENMYARAKWGVFGNYNVNKAYLKDCDINRFDIHCYGKDISFDNCNFVDLYNQFSAIYGEVKFKDCTFTNFTPVLIEGSYNAFTAFDVLFENCTFNFDKKHASLVYFSSFSKDENSRPELKEKSLPNITIKRCRVNVADGLKRWYVFDTKKVQYYEGCFSHISKVDIEDLSTNEETVKMEVFSNKINTVTDVQLKMNLK